MLDTLKAYHLRHRSYRPLPVVTASMAAWPAEARAEYDAGVAALLTPIPRSFWRPDMNGRLRARWELLILCGVIMIESNKRIC